MYRVIGKHFQLTKYRYSKDLVLKDNYNTEWGYGSKELTRGDNPEYYNCIPYGYALPGNRPGIFEVKPMYASGIIDAYDELTDAVGIYYGENLVWFARESILIWE